MPTLQGRTETGLLESYLARAQEIEGIATKRLTAPDPPTGREQAIVEQIRRQAVGLQRMFRSWIRVRLELGSTSPQS